MRGKSSRKVPTRLLAGVIVLVTALVAAVLISPAQATGGGEVRVDLQFSSGGTTNRARTMPAGDGGIFFVDYSCGNTVACTNVVITVPFDDGLTLGTPTLPLGVTTGPRSGNVLKFNIASMATSTAGRIQVPATIIPWTTRDGSILTQYAAITAFGSTPATSQQVVLTAGAGSDTSVNVTLVSGGALGQPATYAVNYCVAAKAPTSTYGALAIQANSQLSANLPVGAVLEESNGGFVDGNTITWTLPEIRANGCLTKQFRVAYPLSSNTLGDSKTVDASWHGAVLYGAEGNLGDGSLTRSLSGAFGADAVSAEIATQKVDDNLTPSHRSVVGGTVTQSYHVGNSGTSTWDSASLVVPISESLTTTGVSVFNVGSGDAELWIGVDGGAASSVATIGGGLTRTFDFTRAPDNALLGGGTNITSVELHFTEIKPAASGDPLSISSTVRTATRATTPVTIADGDNFTLSGSFSKTTLGTTDGMSLPLEYGISLAKPVLAPQLVMQNPGDEDWHWYNTYGDPRVIPPAENHKVMFATIYNSSAIPIDDPALMVLLPNNVQYDGSWSVNADYTLGSTLDSAIGTPTFTKVDSFPDSVTAGWWGGRYTGWRTFNIGENPPGGYLMRWTWPAGKKLMPNTFYRVKFNVTVAAGSWGQLDLKTFATSRTNQVFDCGGGVIDRDQGWDKYDRDGNGQTDEKQCYEDRTFEVDSSQNYRVVPSIKGAFDTDFTEGPATSYSAPHSNDTFRSSFQNTGYDPLIHAKTFTKLPRPGDTYPISGAARSPATATFPVWLRGKPTLPAGLPQSATISWSEVANPCIAELGANPSGCVSPDWHVWDDTHQPTQLKDVVSLKFDFGENTLNPFSSWNVDIPVTAPGVNDVAGGAAEPDYAVYNAKLFDPSTNEAAVGSSAAVAAPLQNANNPLPAVESTGLTLQMPGPYGPNYTQDRRTTGIVGAVQTTSLPVPQGGSVVLMSGGSPVTGNEITIPGEGRYVLNPSDGTVTFTPEPDFLGQGVGVTFEATDSTAQHATATYVPTTVLPDPPSPPDKTSSGVTPFVQNSGAAFTVPDQGTFSLVTPGLADISSNTWTVAGQGTYVLDRTSKLITFTPVSDYLGTATPVRYRVTDRFGQTGYATYTPTVLPPAPSAFPATSTGLVNLQQSYTFTIPSGSTMELRDGSTPTSRTIPGQGTYTLNPVTGKVTFTPVTGYTGTPTPVTYRFTNSNNQSASATYTPTVVGTPVADPKTSTGPMGQSQSTNVNKTFGTTVTLRDGGADVTTITTAQGTFTLNPTTGVITFAPVNGFTGTASPVTFRFTDPSNNTAEATYTPTVYPAGPSASPDTSRDKQGVVQHSQAMTIPTSGSIELRGGESLTTRTVPGEGVYTLDQGTGVITFTPDANFVGTATPVTFRLIDQYGQTSDATYTPTVVGPPVPVPYTSSEIAGVPQFSTAIPGTDTITLPGMDGNNEVHVTGGTYKLETSTRTVKFTPDDGYVGTPAAVTYRLTDEFGQTGDSTYTPTVTTPPGPVATPKTSTGTGSQSTTVTIPTNGTLRLWDGSSEVTSITVPGQGTYSVSGGTITFVPEAGFTGSPAPVQYQVTDRWSQSARSTYSPTVTGSSGGAHPDTSSAKKGQSVTIDPLGNDTPPAGVSFQSTSVNLAKKHHGKTARRITTNDGRWSTNSSSGAITFTPGSNFVGVATIHYRVRGTDGQYYWSTASVIVRGTARGKVSETVYFNVRSAAFTTTANRQLRQLISKIPRYATSRALSVGYVQPERYRQNDLTLSTARATNIVRFLQKSLSLTETKVSGNGRGREKNWKARRASVTVTWTMTQS